MLQRQRLVGLGAGLVWLLPAVVLAQAGPQRDRAPDDHSDTGTILLTQKDIPITITKSGSYRLDGNLKVVDPTVDAILVAADDVTIDLNGFTIRGPPQSPRSNGSAIETAPNCCWNVVVRNGVIRGFFEARAACVHLTGGGGHRVENVHVSGCGGIAIYADGVVTRCEVTDSGSGIGVGQGGVVTDNMLRRNMWIGVHTNTPGTTPEGIRAGGVTIARNTIEVPFGGVCIMSPGANHIVENTCHGGWGGLVLTDGASFYARNFIFGSVVPVVDGGVPNIDGRTLDPALSNVIVP